MALEIVDLEFWVTIIDRKGKELFPRQLCRWWEKTKEGDLSNDQVILFPKVERMTRATGLLVSPDRESRKRYLTAELAAHRTLRKGDMASFQPGDVLLEVSDWEKLMKTLKERA